QVGAGSPRGFAAARRPAAPAAPAVASRRRPGPSSAHAPPAPGSCLTSGVRQPPSCEQVLSSTATLPLQLNPSIVVGFLHTTTRHATSVVPAICVLHCP